MTRSERTGNAGTTYSNRCWTKSYQFPAPRLKKLSQKLDVFKLQKFDTYDGETWYACRFRESFHPGHTTVAFEAFILRSQKGEWVYLERDDVDYSS